jgi:hypothetical protein
VWRQNCLFDNSTSQVIALHVPTAGIVFQLHVRGLVSMSCRLLLLVAESSAVVGEHGWLHIARATLVAWLMTTCRRVLADSRSMRMLFKKAFQNDLKVMIDRAREYWKRVFRRARTQSNRMCNGLEEARPQNKQTLKRPRQ